MYPDVADDSGKLPMYSFYSAFSKVLDRNIIQSPEITNSGVPSENSSWCPIIGMILIMSVGFNICKAGSD